MIGRLGLVRDGGFSIPYASEADAVVAIVTVALVTTGRHGMIAKRHPHVGREIVP